MNAIVQHDVNHTTTSVVDEATNKVIATFDESIPWSIRLKLATNMVKELKEVSLPKKYEVQLGVVGWCVKTKKDGIWFSICDTYANADLGSSKEIAILIAELLNARHDNIQKNLNK
jgi:hypothetical protein